MTEQREAMLIEFAARKNHAGAVQAHFGLIEFAARKSQAGAVQAHFEKRLRGVIRSVYWTRAASLRPFFREKKSNSVWLASERSGFVCQPELQGKLAALSAWLLA